MEAIINDAKIYWPELYNWANANRKPIVISSISCYLTFKATKFIYKIYKFNKALSHIPVNPAFPVVFGGIQKFGGVDYARKIQMLGDAASEMEQKSDLKVKVPAGVTKAYFIPFVPFLIISEQEVLNKILTSNVHINKIDIIKKSLGLAALKETNIFLANREIWKEKRRTLSKGMHQGLFDTYGQNIYKIAKNWADNLIPSGEKQNSIETIYLNQQYMLSFDMLLENIFGASANIISNEQKEGVMKLVLQALPLIESRVSRPILANDFIWKIFSWWKGLDGTEVVKQLKSTVLLLADVRMKSLTEMKESENGDENSQNFQNQSGTLIIDILLDLYHENRLTTDEMISEALIFFVGSFAMISHSLSGMIYCLSHKTSVDQQEKLVQEIDRFFPEKSDLDNESIDNLRETLKKMDYLDAVVKEGLRLYSPVHYVTRCFDRDLELDNLKIKVDPETKLQSFLLLNAAMKSEIKNSSADKNDYKNFRPERFINQEYNQKAYMPFSKGVRDCIAQSYALLSMKIQLINIYKNFRTEVVCRDAEDEEIVRDVQSNFLFHMKNEPCMRFLKR